MTMCVEDLRIAMKDADPDAEVMIYSAGYRSHLLYTVEEAVALGVDDGTDGDETDGDGEGPMEEGSKRRFVIMEGRQIGHADSEVTRAF